MEYLTVTIVFTAILCLALPALYVAYTAVIVSVVLISYPVDVSKTPPISPAMQCVMTSVCSTSVVLPFDALRGRCY